MSLYLKKFETTSEYEAYINGRGVILPNVSFCEDERGVHYNPYVQDYSKDYLTLVALEDGTFSFYLGDSDTYMDSISYSIDNGETWVTYDGEDRGITALTTPTITTGNKVLWKGVGKAVGDETSRFESTGRFNVQGNIMSLLYGDDFADKTQFDSEYQYQLSGLFENNNKVIDASNLILPATTLTNRCYCYMFYGCTNLAKTPKLPATTLAEECYNCMFYGCTSLTTAPELPATTLTESCYSSMFYGCTNLTTAPELPATTLVVNCYGSMFYGCTSLTTAPELPATTLTPYCYNSMFYNTNVLPDCTNIDFSNQSVVASGGLQGLFAGTKITDAQLDTILKEHGINNYSLPVTTLADYCYNNMFSSCKSLTTAPQLPATTLAERCYSSMFQNCTSLTTAPELPATTLATWCYSSMFKGCTSLNSIKCLATNISASYCTHNWINGVAASGTFTKAASMTKWTTGTNGIPSGWTVEDAA